MSDTITVQVKDSLGAIAFATFTIPPAVATTTPTFTPAGGTYSSTQTVSIASNTGATIYYTTDGSTPTTSSSVYSAPLTVSASETIKAIATAAGYAQSAVGSAAYVISAGGGSVQVFNYPNFASSPSTISLPGDGSGFINNGIGLPTDAVGPHESAAGWYKTQQNISGGFTTNFTLQIPSGNAVPSIIGVSFVIQNCPNNGNPFGFYGVNFVGDANLAGYGWYDLSRQYQCENSIAICMIMSGQNNQAQDYKNGGAPSTIGLYINGGTRGIFIPELDMVPFGINLYSGHLLSGNIVYDGSFITIVLLDTVTFAQARFTWPLNIPNAIGGDLAWVGFTGADGPGSGSINTVNSWSFYTGINARLTTPTFSPSGGSYSSSQTVTISYPAGSTCYYTTNGLTPTSASTPYTGPITVSANQYVQAVAIESNFTDSFVGAANYLISAANTINFGSGFSGASNLITTVANAAISGSSLNLITGTTAPSGAYGAVGAAWYVAPIPITSFNTTFVLKSNSSIAAGSGMCFVMQNQNGTSTDASSLTVSGGPFAVGGLGGFGYSNNPPGSGIDINGFLTSVAVFLDVQNNKVGVVTNGALPTGGTSISGLLLDSGHPISINIVYSGTTLTVNLKDLSTLTTVGPFAFTENIQSIVGANTAYVGLTYSMGFNGGASTTQTIVSWIL